MKILFLTSRFPYPLEKGDKLRAYHQIRELSRKHQVILFSITENRIQKKWDDAIEEVTYYHQTVYLSAIRKLFGVLRGFMNKLPFQVNYFYAKSRKKSVDKLITRFDPDIIFCQLIRMSEYVKDASTPKILDYMDAFSKGIQRRMEQQPFYMKGVYRMEYKRLAHYEKDIYDAFNASVIISVADRNELHLEANKPVSIVRNGVNFDYYHPQPDTPKNFDLVFTGNMSYPPNVSAVLYLYHEILPLVKQTRPDVRVMIAGANPVHRIRELNSPDFVVTGWVEHMNVCYAQSRIFIAPMQIGTGLQNKLLEAMAMQLPCITSPLVNQSLDAEAGKEILIASGAEEYARAISTLLGDIAYAGEVANAGHLFVKKHFSWEKTTETIEQIMQSLQ